jgi:regulatory protein
MKMRANARHMRIPTAQDLEKAALFYLSRFAASESSLRRVLQNRLRKTALRNPQFAADNELRNQLHDAIDVIVGKHKKSGVLNDENFAALKISSLRRAGRSARAIRQRLGRKGVAPATIESMLAREEEGGDEGDLKAARKLAQRRHLGSFRKGADTPEIRRKEMAIMARAGFSLDTVRLALGKDVDYEEND